MIIQGRFGMTIEHNDCLALIGSSSTLETVHHLIQQVAKTEATVLVLGESGTGKELVARIIHQLSNRATSPFIPVNCAAIPMELLESELFGHEKGSFTGAFAARQGRFELAAGGTLFLDEIGDMPLSMQAKLLRVLQEKTFERVGGNKSIQADGRVIAATHKNLSSDIKNGSFREDLFYRLNVFPIEILPLRERKEDILILINHFIHLFAKQTGHQLTLSDASLNTLERYYWPGNVRELANLIERLFILYPNQTVQPEQLPEHFFSSKRDDKNMTILTTSSTETPILRTAFDLKEHLTQVELTFINEALSQSNGVVAKAAKRLGLRRTTLVEKMKKYGIGRDLNLSVEQDISLQQKMNSD